MTTSAPWASVPVFYGDLHSRETAGATDADLYAFRRLSGDGDRPDSLDQGTFERFQRLSLWLYYQNPLARRLNDVPTDMVLGAGVNIDVEKVRGKAKKNGDRVKELITRFLEHPANEFEIRLPSLFTMLNTTVGELFLPVFASPENGDVAIGFLEHHLVQDVIWNPKNRMEAIAVIQRPPAPGEKPLWWNVIRAEQGVDKPEFPAHPSIKDRKKAATDREIVHTDENAENTSVSRAPQDYTYAGEIFYFKANVLGTGRGRSAIEPTLDWLHAYDNFLFGDLRNANMQAAFVWDVTIEDADVVTLKQRADEIRQNPPRPGEVNFHNQKEKWEALSPNLNAASHTDLGIQVKKIIGLALGLPPHLIGAENNTNRTSSISSDIPFLRRMEQKQKVLHFFVKTILDYQLDQKRHAGILKGAERPYPYRIVLPSLTAGEMVAVAEALANVTTAIIAAMESGVTSLADARRIWYAYGLQEADIPEGLEDQVKQERKDGLLPDPVQLKKDEMELKAKQPAAPGAASASGRTVVRAKTGQGAPRAAQRGK
jgi:hypothetical protein